MEKIAAFKTTDGAMFFDRKEAKAHQKILDKFDSLTKLAEDTAGSFIDKTRLGNWLTTNIGFIERILKGEKVDIAAERAKFGETPVVEDKELSELLSEVTEDIVAS